jgi:putative membrane protein
VKLRPEDRYPAACLAVLTVWWALMAIAPSYRDSWLHENLLVFVGVPFLVWSHPRWLRLSNVSYTLITIFLCMHLVGAHYTYSEVPLFDRIKDWCELSRNHYDRLVHFSFGLLLAYPVRELYMRVAAAKGFWSYYLPVEVVMAFSMLYEIIEWLFVEAVDPAAGTAFLGTQGDVWDAHNDMALASLGAFIAMLITALINAYLQADFAREWAESLRIKGREPLGETAIMRMLMGKRKQSTDERGPSKRN